MKKIYLTIAVSFFTIFSTLLAQNPQLPCGTPSGKTEWLKDYQLNPSRFHSLLEARGANTMYLPVTLQIVGTDDSLGMAGLDAVLASFCELNQDFKASGIQFFIEPPIRYVYETAFYRHDSVKAGGIRMLQNNVTNTINVYFVADPAGNCGYNLPYAGIAMNNGCISGHTFAHEMGHCLNLPHTFIGWEGGTSWGGNPVQYVRDAKDSEIFANYTFTYEIYNLSQLYLSQFTPWSYNYLLKESTKEDVDLKPSDITNAYIRNQPTIAKYYYDYGLA